MSNTTKYTLLFFGIGFIIHTTVLLLKGLNDHIKKADCILVLGNQVLKDGTLSMRLKSRMDKAIELYKGQYASRIVVSGGLGKEGYYEAREMQKYAVSKGVSMEAILIEDQSLTTYQTMVNFTPIAKENQFNSVIIVSQYFHLHRSIAMLHHTGKYTSYHAHADYYEWRDLYAVCREFLAYYYFKAATLI